MPLFLSISAEGSFSFFLVCLVNPLCFVTTDHLQVTGLHFTLFVLHPTSSLMTDKEATDLSMSRKETLQSTKKTLLTTSKSNLGRMYSSSMRLTNVRYYFVSDF